MSVYISVELRSLVKERALNTCEYCLIYEEDAFFSFHIDHIINIKHGGETTIDNLAYACAICNRDKGSDLGSFLESPDNLTRFYNPRTDKWVDHFKLEELEIQPITDIGKVTVKIFKFNDEQRILEREELIKTNSFPSPSAL